MLQKESLTALPMTYLEQQLKQMFLRRPDVQDHVLSAAELSDYIAWMAKTHGKPADISLSHLPVRPSGTQMTALANRMLEDPTDPQALLSLSHGYDRQSEDRYFQANHDISVSRMLRYMPSHWHTNGYFEIYYAFSGSCPIHFPDETIMLKQGTVLIVAPSAVHASPCYSDACILVYYMLRASTFQQIFWNLLPPESLMADFFRRALSGQHPTSYLHFETGDDPDIHHVLLQIYEEYQQEAAYQSQLINALMSTFFIVLLRRYEGTARLPRTEDFYWKHQFSAILSHIQTHYATVTLPELARKFHYSEKQISRIVRNCMGMTYNRLILKLRMEQAARLLRQGNTSIEQIATVTGYSTKSSFYRTFLKYYGCTPGDYTSSSQLDNEAT